jgi:hypothetical protein
MHNFWSNWGRPLGFLAVLLGIAFAIGAFVVAPAIHRGSDTYIPPGVANLKVGVLKLVDPDGREFEVPVRIVDTEDARERGLRDVGPLAMKTMVLYSTFKTPRNPTTSSTRGVRAPIAVAVFDDQGALREILHADMTMKSISVSIRHRGILFAKETLFDLFGVGPGTVLPQNALRWLK